jgi:hypothetical protein
VLPKTPRFITECPPALFEIWSLEEDASQFDAPILVEEKKQDFTN